jgi:hypothetical protein
MYFSPCSAVLPANPNPNPVMACCLPQAACWAVVTWALHPSWIMSSES